MSANRATYTEYEPVSISPAEPGWRAVYIHDPAESDPGWSADPLIAWGVFEVTTRPAEGSSARVDRQGRQILGVIFDDYAQCPEEVSNFWRYLRPGAPDPTSAEVAAEQQRRAELAEAVRRRREATG
ncbi:MAG: hypothetical protein J2P32_11760 [Actinobacteria bacterium]|nr:hypothetical protein [Actinomycetota bacterium]